MTERQIDLRQLEEWEQQGQAEGPHTLDHFVIGRSELLALCKAARPTVDRRHMTLGEAMRQARIAVPSGEPLAVLWPDYGPAGTLRRPEPDVQMLAYRLHWPIRDTLPRMMWVRYFGMSIRHPGIEWTSAEQDFCHIPNAPEPHCWLITEAEATILAQTVPHCDWWAWMVKEIKNG